MFFSRPKLCRKRKKREESKKDEIEKLHTIISSEASASAPEAMATNAVWDGMWRSSDVTSLMCLGGDIIKNSLLKFSISLPVRFYLEEDQSYSFFAQTHVSRQNTHTHTKCNSHSCHRRTDGMEANSSNLAAPWELAERVGSSGERMTQSFHTLI